MLLRVFSLVVNFENEFDTDMGSCIVTHYIDLIDLVLVATPSAIATSEATQVSVTFALQSPPLRNSVELNVNVTGGNATEGTNSACCHFLSWAGV